MSYAQEILKLERKLASLKAKAEKSAAKNKKTAIQKVSLLVKKLGYASIQHLLQNVDDAIASVPDRIRKRTRITDSIRASIVAALKTGQTGAEVAKAHKISTASVNIIKAKAGLTKPKKAGRSTKPVPGTAKPKAPKKIANQVLRRAEPRAGKAKIPAKNLTKKIYGPKGVVALAEPAKEAPAAV
jgi:hypothetical protein